MLHASMLVIGDEILGGFVQDTNSGWLAAQLRTHGVLLDWIHTVPDELDAIDAALQTELARARPRLIVTSGGIGSTPDDITYEAIAASLDRELVEEPTIAGRIDGALEWTRSLGIDVTPQFAWHMRRMERVPAGATLVHHGGWAPGIRLDVDGGAREPRGASIVVLPGVPSQFRTIVTEGVLPSLVEGRNEGWTVAEVTHSFPESALNLCFARVVEDHPDVKLGSYPGAPMIVRLMGPEADVAAALADVRAYVDALEADPAGARLAAAWSARLGTTEEERR